MQHISHTIMCKASENNRVREHQAFLWQDALMVDGSWKQRLRKAIDADTRSEAAICESAGLSRNYIGSIFRDNREPTVQKLLALCDSLAVSPAFILVGLDASPETVSLMALLEKNPGKRAALTALLDDVSTDQ